MIRSLTALLFCFLAVYSGSLRAQDTPAAAEIHYALQGTGPAGKQATITVSPGKTETLDFGADGSFATEVEEIGFPEEITGSYSLPVHDPADVSVTGTRTINFIWNRFNGDFRVNGTLTGKAKVTLVSGSGNTEVYTADESGALTGFRIPTGDFQNDAKTVTLGVQFTKPIYHYDDYGNVDWIEYFLLPEIKISIATGLIDTTQPPPPPPSSGGGGGGGFSLPFNALGLVAGLAGQIDGTWVQGLRDMAAQVTTGFSNAIQQDSAIQDAADASAAAVDAADAVLESTEAVSPGPGVGETATLSVETALVETRSDEAAAEINEDVVETTTEAIENPPTSTDICQYKCSLPATVRNRICASGGPACGADEPDRVTACATLYGTVPVDAMTDCMNLMMDNFSPPNGFENLQDVVNQGSGVGAAERLFNLRSYMAMRSVISNSFEQLAAARAPVTRSDNAIVPALKAHMKRLGYDDALLNKIITDTPSMYTQMMIMAKYRYQDPNYYIRMAGETEQNIRREGVMASASRSVVWRQILESLRRREMLLATILESKIRRAEAQLASPTPSSIAPAK